jgi:hypothetical protein
MKTIDIFFTIRIVLIVIIADYIFKGNNRKRKFYNIDTTRSKGFTEEIQGRHLH